MSDLLHVGPLKGIRARPGNLMAEFVVNPDTAPYLVSSSRDVLWVEKLSGERILRAAFRKGNTPHDIYPHIVGAVVEEGRRREWGNIHPLTKEGVVEAINHLYYYEIDEVELLVGVGVPPEVLEGIEEPIELDVEWLSNQVVVVPADRGFLGFFGLAGNGQFVVVVHNGSRGMAVATA